MWGLMRYSDYRKRHPIFLSSVYSRYSEVQELSSRKIGHQVKLDSMTMSSHKDEELNIVGRAVVNEQYVPLLRGGC